MTLYFCRWDDRCSIIVDDESEEKAREVAFGIAREQPDSIVPMPPRAFVVEVGDEDPPTIEPFEDTLDAIALLDGDTENVEVEDDYEECEAEAETADDGEIFVCNLNAGHGGPHRAVGRGGLLLKAWEE